MPRNRYWGSGTAFLGEEPGPELRIVIGLRPGVVAYAGVDGELHGGAELLEGVVDLVAVLHGHGTVFVAMEDSRGQVLEAAGIHSLR